MKSVLSLSYWKKSWPLLAVLAAVPVAAQPSSSSGAVCSALNAKCDSPNKKFEPYELPFHLPRKLKDNTAYHSVPFYGIVLKRFTTAVATECDGGEWTISIERERQRIQKLFPSSKVFASYQCPDMGALSYTVNGKLDNGVFIAVYAGKTQREAQKQLTTARKVSRQVKIERMSAAFERIVQ